MNSIQAINFVAGEVYAFTTDPHDINPLFGIFDRRSGDRVILEVVSASEDASVRYGVLLPETYLFVRPATRSEIRDFCFNYGFDCGMLHGQKMTAR